MPGARAPGPRNRPLATRIDVSDQPVALDLIAALAGAGFETRFAGGFVRDRLLGRPAGDVDLATAAPPDRTVGTLRGAGFRVVPTGIDHGTVTVVPGEPVGPGEPGPPERPIEVTSLRRDVATDGRHARVAFGADWVEDAGRRDFTFNALFADADGTVHDHTGGIEDARRGIVRFIGDADARIREDYLRILRFFRFQAVLGRTEPDEAVLETLARHRDGLARLSAERVTRELLGLLGAGGPGPSWALAERCGVARAMLGDCRQGAEALGRLAARERRAGLEPRPLRRLAALGGESGRLALSAAQTAELEAMNAASAGFAGDEPPDTASLLNGLYRYGHEACRDGFLLAWSRAEAWREADAAERLARMGGLERPVFPLSGRDILALGAEPGPAVGALLDAVESWWIAGGFAAGREELLGRARSLYPSSSASSGPPTRTV